MEFKVERMKACAVLGGGGGALITHVARQRLHRFGWHVACQFAHGFHFERAAQKQVLAHIC